jgi:hypothetical protein
VRLVATVGAVTRAGLAAGALLALIPLVAFAACSSKDAPCTGPSSGAFSLQLGNAQPVAAAIECEAGSDGATACGSEPPPFGGATWSVAVDGGTATLTSSEDGGSSWSCQATPPSSPSCYLLVSCGPGSLGDAGPGDVQIQLFASASEDAVVLVHQVTGECCAYSYTGSWQE